MLSRCMAVIEADLSKHPLEVFDQPEQSLPVPSFFKELSRSVGFMLG